MKRILIVTIIVYALDVSAQNSPDNFYGTAALFTTAAGLTTATNLSQTVNPGNNDMLPASVIRISLKASSDTMSVKDTDGNIYHEITIGSQVWMKENLKTTKFNDGTSIPLVTDNKAWSNLKSPGYCWFRAKYGALYNWYTVGTGKLCPQGWHVPTDAEWTTLTTFLGGVVVAGGKLKEVSGWQDPNTGASNITGFSALPGSHRSRHYGSMNDVGNKLGYWWSSTAYNSANAWGRYMSFDYNGVYRSYRNKGVGYSVRCIKD